MEKYNVYDWDGSVVLENVNINEICNYFNFEKCADVYDVREKIAELYDGTKAPEIIEA